MRKLFIIVSLILAVSADAAFADTVVITNKNVGDTELSQADVKEIFLGKKKKWSDNSRIHFAVVKDAAVHEVFLQTYIKRSSNQYKNHWKNMVFTGKGKMPKSFATAAELVEFVANTSGAIGYADSRTPARNVNTINVK